MAVKKDSMERTDTTGAVGSGIDVADCSFDAEYPLGNSAQGATMADIKRGYAIGGAADGKKVK